MRNIELKARLNHWESAETRCAEISATFEGDFRQTDTYFSVPRGRLKLRESSPGDPQLIYYQRPDCLHAAPSDYRIETLSPSLAALLKDALGQLAVVDKTRSLWLWHKVRIHLDCVEGLGQFIEFEAVLSPHHSDLDGREKVDHLRTVFALTEQDLIDASYLDMTLAATEAREGTNPP